MHSIRHIRLTSRTFSSRQCHRRLVKRHFLSDAFKCEDVWKSRLSSPVLQKVDLEKFFFDVERKFNREKRGSAIDVDIFANKASPDNEGELEHLEELLFKFRRTPQTVTMMPSTTYAVARLFLESGETDTLMRMLDDRLNYGLFPDTPTLAMMLNHFLLQENLRDAAKTAISMALQEEGSPAEEPIAAEMAFYSIFKYALLTGENAEKEPWEPWKKTEVKESASGDEEEEEIRERVKWADTGYFDDQFDLTEKSHLVGKTLVYLAGKCPEQGVVEASAKLLGLVMFEKWDAAVSLTKDPQHKFAKCAVDRAKEVVEAAAAEKCPAKESLLPALEGLQADEADTEGELKSRVESSVAKNEAALVVALKERMSRWTAIREEELERQLATLTAEARREEVARKRAEMAEKEERLFFFDREKEREREEATKYEEWRKTWPKNNWKSKITLKKKEVVSDDYVPPVGRSPALRKA